MIRVGITMGDPAGVGPEILLLALGDEETRAGIVPLAFADTETLLRLSRHLGLKMDFEIRPTDHRPAETVPGAFTPEGGRATLACLRAAADALERGEIDALVTGPIHKRSFQFCAEAGPGQTEWLARRFGARRALMMLAGPSLRVLLATTHLPLRAVPAALDRDDLVETVELASRELRRFFLSGDPRLALAALNPHGEEDGEMGAEEREILVPAVAELRRRGIELSGPISADAVFALARAGRFDAVVALYHDQGLAPLKTLHPREAVNVTLGLGLVRTSPGHGVAYDIAGQGRADPAGMKAAIRLAAQMAARSGP